MEYVVAFGNTVKENGNWNTDGMRATEERTFDDLDEAREFYDGYDVKDTFATEWITATVKPRGRGFYAELAETDGDMEWNVLDYKECNSDDMERDE